MSPLNKIIASAAGAASILASLAGAAPSTLPANLDKRTSKFAYGFDKVRGVNLGGWLVLEPWITPSIFSSQTFVDEYTLGQQLGPQQGFNVLSQHWQSWITQQDFFEIASHGMNHVRIPIGWWAIEPIAGNPYIVGAYPYLSKALAWAQSAGLKVLIDLHGAPGSQNGFDNSGRVGDIRWMQHQSMARTHRALNRLRDDHAHHPAVAAIELVNEPMGPVLGKDRIEQFYYDGYGDLSTSNVGVVFHDAFEDVNGWNDFGTGLANLILDTHHYEVFEPGYLGMNGESHVNAACDFGNRMAANKHVTIAGEWTGAMTDCAKWLNGIGIGARYDGSYFKAGQGSTYIGSCAGLQTGSVSQLDAAKKQDIARFVSAQMDAFERGGNGGWIWWTWKTEGAPGWDMRDLFANGVIASPVSGRKYPGLCD